MKERIRAMLRTINSNMPVVTAILSVALLIALLCQESSDKVKLAEIRANWALRCIKEVYMAERLMGNTKVDDTVIANCSAESFDFYPEDFFDGE